MPPPASKMPIFKHPLQQQKGTFLKYKSSKARVAVRLPTTVASGGSPLGFMFFGRLGYGKKHTSGAESVSVSLQGVRKTVYSCNEEVFSGKRKAIPDIVLFCEM